jgi:hypothetical protein
MIAVIDATIAAIVAMVTRLISNFFILAWYKAISRHPASPVHLRGRAIGLGLDGAYESSQDLLSISKGSP